jgi:hypothetical protein
VNFLQELSQQWKDKSGSFVFYDKFIGHSHPLFKDWKKFAKLNMNYRNAYQVKSDPVVRDFRTTLNKEKKGIVAIVVNPGGELNSTEGREIHAQCLVVFEENANRHGT